MFIKQGDGSRSTPPPRQSIPGAPVGFAPKSNAKNNKKKKDTPKVEEANGMLLLWRNCLDVTEKADADLLSIAGGASPADTSATGLSEKDKKVRNLEKKIRQIRELKERKAKGDTLEATQVSMIDMIEARVFLFFFFFLTSVYTL